MEQIIFCHMTARVLTTQTLLIVKTNLVNNVQYVFFFSKTPVQIRVLNVNAQHTFLNFSYLFLQPKKSK